MDNTQQVLKKTFIRLFSIGRLWNHPEECLRFVDSLPVQALLRMDVLDSPLNLAHQQGRRADAFENSGRYKEAIDCHRKAAGYLLQAQTATTVPCVLESLSLQHRHHTKQQEILKQKFARQKHCQSQSSMTQTPLDNTVEAQSPSPQSTDGHDGAPNYQPDKQPESVAITMGECDSLLCMLRDRAEDKGVPSGIPEYFTTKQMSQGKKQLKRNEDVIEELCTQNEALRYHIKELLEELDQKDRDILHLKEENERLKSKPIPVAPPMTDSVESEEPLPTIKLDDLPNLQLAPLEKPEFDFNSFQLPGSHSPTPDPPVL